MKEQLLYAWLLLKDETFFSKKLLMLSSIEFERLMIQFERNSELELFLSQVNFKQGLKKVTRNFKTSFQPNIRNAGLLELDGLNQMQMASKRQITKFLNNFLKDFFTISTVKFEESVSIQDIMNRCRDCAFEANGGEIIGQYKKLRYELEIGAKNQKLRDDIALDKLRNRR